MRFEATAGALTSALAAAELVLDDRSNIEALKMTRLTAKNGGVEFVVDALDRCVAARAPISVSEPGEAAARCTSLVGVLAGLRADKIVRLVGDEDDVVISADRSRFRIPGLKIDQLPQSARLEKATAEFSLNIKDALRLIEATGYAASDEESRYYMNGVYLHTAGTAAAPTLRGVATDGRCLAQCDLPLPAGAENMPGIIVPNKTIAIVNKLLTKLLKHKDAPESITFRASDRLLELLLPNLQLTSKLIDGTFPDYDRVVPKNYKHSVIVDRAEFAAAIGRVEATLNPETKNLMRTVKLAWGDSALHVTRAHADVDDVLDAETDGNDGAVLQIPYIVEVLDAFPGNRISVAVNGPETPIRFTNPDDPSTFAIVMPIREMQQGERA